jgi:hypothetical protein
LPVCTQLLERLPRFEVNGFSFTAIYLFTLSRKTCCFCAAAGVPPIQHCCATVRSAQACITMIKGILIVNNYGKPRLVKFYQSVVSLSKELEFAPR